VAGVTVLVPLSCARRVEIIESLSRSMYVRAALVLVRFDRRPLSAVAAIAGFSNAYTFSM
jgi:hypothetical protein